MTWLFPLYLLGGAAIIGPILMHLRRRPPQDRVEFSSLMFLDAQTPMPASNRRLENWLLLLLRCLALLLLALMFSRPLWRVESDQAVSQNQATLLLLDRSASMQRGDLWKQALAAATQRLANSAVTDRLAFATFDRESQLLWSFDQDKTSASSRKVTLNAQLAALKPGWSSSDLGKALVDSSNWLTSAQGLSGLKKRIIVITDFQEGMHLDALAGIVWSENIAVEVIRIEAPNSDNFTLSLAANTEEQFPNQNASTRVRLSNSRDSKIKEFKLAWANEAESPTTGYLSPGASRVLSIPGKVGTLTLTGDAWDYDNRIYISPAQPKAVKIVFIGDAKTRDEAASPLFYLSRALKPTPSLRPELNIVPESALRLPLGSELVFISGARLSDPLAKSVREFAELGGLVVSVITESTTPQDLESLTGIATTSWSLGFRRSNDSDSEEDYQMLSEVQTTHPLLRPFADERLRDFTKLRFWKHRKLTLPKESPIEVLARFDQGDPAMLAGSIGKGRLILLTSGWHSADSQLALSTKFVPLLYGWLEAAGFRNVQGDSLLVGDALPLEAAMTIMTPDGQTLTPKVGDTIRAEIPGIYTMGKDRLVAVNLVPEEGRVTPMDLSKLRELGVRIEFEDLGTPAAMNAEDSERLAITEQEARQRAWIWLLGSLLAILAWETWLAGRVRQMALQPAYSSP